MAISDDDLDDGIRFVNLTNMKTYLEWQKETDEQRGNIDLDAEQQQQQQQLKQGNRKRNKETKQRYDWILKWQDGDVSYMQNYGFFLSMNLDSLSTCDGQGIRSNCEGDNLSYDIGCNLCWWCCQYVDQKSKYQESKETQDCERKERRNQEGRAIGTNN
ncbi:hypothetical protein BCR42DRAFT_427744 [Absidia repens]|uniref:Uncharacterized protein n=1 Tax=Absidia repens TaxID=90262 RepID=A0A1X2HZ52_9FUNG|nr:hypothetical protein BCR42DRAFT_427744 [Absidia repens]